MYSRGKRRGSPEVRFSTLNVPEVGRTKEIACSNGKNCENAKNGRPPRRLLGTLLDLQAQGLNLQCNRCRRWFHSKICLGKHVCNAPLEYTDIVSAGAKRTRASACVDVMDGGGSSSGEDTEQVNYTRSILLINQSVGI